MNYHGVSVCLCAFAPWWQKRLFGAGSLSEDNPSCFIAADFGKKLKGIENEAVSNLSST
jgi:hypothetical protein